MRSVAVVLAVWAVWPTWVAAAEAPVKPNIIVVIADDLGYGDVSCNGAKGVETPNIDRLAAEGRRFTSGYCSASTCTPTRYSLLTGKYAFRTPGTGIAPPNGAAIIKPGVETVAGILKRAGYSTAAIGKWHLGLGETAPQWNDDIKPGPLEIGFDHCFLMPTTNDRVPQVYVEDHRVRNLDPKDPLWVGNQKPSDDHPTGVSHRDTLRLNWSKGHNETIHNGIGRIGFYTGGQKARFRDEDVADEWIKHTNQWIEQHKDGPFFLYFASHDIHVPRMPHERFQNKSTLGLRGDAVVEFDWQVGEIMKTLDRLQIAENTLVIVCSDNGPVLDDGYQDGAVEKLGDHKPAGPYRDGKYSVFEGGTRIPFIVRWKGKVEPAVSDDVVCTVDFCSSFASLVGETVSADGCPDSQNVIGALLGRAGAKGRDYHLSQANGPEKLGLRAGDWKLCRLPGGQGKGPRFLLFNLAADPGEQNNLAEQHPEKLKELQLKLAELVNSERTRPVE